jgi:hypothetical protein
VRMAMPMTSPKPVSKHRLLSGFGVTVVLRLPQGRRRREGGATVYIANAENSSRPGQISFEPSCSSSLRGRPKGHFVDVGIGMAAVRLRRP